MKLSKYTLAVLSLAAIFVAACDYSPSDAEYYKEVAPPKPKHFEVQSPLPIDKDTVYINESKYGKRYSCTIGLQEQKHKILGMKIYRDGVLTDSTNNNHFYLPLRYTNPERIMNPYKLDVELYAKSGSGSLADNLNAEAYVLQYSWFIYPYSTTDLKNEINFSDDNGKLKIEPVYSKGEYIQSVYLQKMQQGPYSYKYEKRWKLWDETGGVNSVIDDEYDNQDTWFKLVYHLKSSENDSIVMPAVQLTNEMENMTLDSAGNKYYLKWKKPKYSTFFTKYEIYRYSGDYNKELMFETEDLNVLQCEIPVHNYVMSNYDFFLVCRTDAEEQDNIDDLSIYEMDALYPSYRSYRPYVRFYDYDKIMRYKDDYLVYSDYMKLVVYNYKEDQIVSEIQINGAFDVSPDRSTIVWIADNKLHMSDYKDLKYKSSFDFYLDEDEYNYSGLVLSNNEHVLLRTNKKAKLLNLNSSSVVHEYDVDANHNNDWYVIDASKNGDYFFENEGNLGILRYISNDDVWHAEFPDVNKVSFSRTENEILFMNEKGNLYKYNVSTSEKEQFATCSEFAIVNCVDKYVYVYDSQNIYIYDATSLELLEHTECSQSVYKFSNNISVFTDEQIYFKGARFQRRVK